VVGGDVGDPCNRTCTRWYTASCGLSTQERSWYAAGYGHAPGSLPDVAQIGTRWVPLGALSAVTMWPETVQQLLVGWGEGGRPLVPAYLGDCP